MECLEHIDNVYDRRIAFSPFIQAYNILIGILNITGNAILIWALRRTSQTKTISFQFIVIMSASDLTAGITSMVCITLVLFEKYQNNCWLKLVSLIAVNTFTFFSAGMIFLIAFDRYLRMKYLERYSLKFTKKKGYLLVIILFAAALLATTFFILPFSRDAYNIYQVVIILMGILLLISVILLYNSALRILRRRAHLITSSIINQNKALGKAAKRVSICFIILAGPIIFFHILDGINKKSAIIDADILAILFWIAYITYLGNGFCSSVIFVSQNIKIQRLLRTVVMGYWNSIRPTVALKDANT